MKYFKITKLSTREAFFVSSDLPNETPAHVALSAHLDTENKYVVQEVSAKEFYGFIPHCYDLDVDDDWDYRDTDDEYYD